MENKNKKEPTEKSQNQTKDFPRRFFSMHLFSSIVYFALTFYIPIGIMKTETHIRSLQNPTKFVKIAKNSRDSTITYKSRLLKYKINKSILNQNKCKLTRNQQPTTPRPGSALLGLAGSPWDGSFRNRAPIPGRIRRTRKSVPLPQSEDSKWTIVS